MTTPSIQQEQGTKVATLLPQPHEAQPITLRKIERENSTRILHRRPNFFVFTAPQPLDPNNPAMGINKEAQLVSEQQRRAGAPTKMLPVVPPVKKSGTSLPTWLEAIFVVVGLVASFAAHAYNTATRMDADCCLGTVHRRLFCLW